MSLEKIEVGTAGINDLGQLQFDSAWREPEVPRMAEVIHTVDTLAIFVEPKHVLYWHNLWGRNGQGVNSHKRFSHMLGLRSVPLMGRTDDYESSLKEATTSSEVTPPSEKRLQSLVNQANRYNEITSKGERVSRLATSTVRILFRYNPPAGESLAILHDYILGL